MSINKEKDLSQRRVIWWLRRFSSVEERRVPQVGTGWDRHGWKGPCPYPSLGRPVVCDHTPRDSLWPRVDETAVFSCSTSALERLVLRRLYHPLEVSIAAEKDL